MLNMRQHRSSLFWKPYLPATSVRFQGSCRAVENRPAAAHTMASPTVNWSSTPFSSRTEKRAWRMEWLMVGSVSATPIRPRTTAQCSLSCSKECECDVWRCEGAGCEHASVRCEVWACEVWGVGVWCVNVRVCEVWGVRCERARCEGWECDVWTCECVRCEGWECEVWACEGVRCGSVTCEVWGCEMCLCVRG